MFGFKKFYSDNFSKSKFQPFHRGKVKIKNEVVPMSLHLTLKNKSKNNYIEPLKWNGLIKNKNTIILDSRKPFEYDIGTFKGAINPNTKNFRDFKNYLTNLKKNEPVGMFCTGGIRCEKATNYLNNQGFKNVYMLKGGIINYFNKTKPSKNKKVKSKK